MKNRLISARPRERLLSLQISNPSQPPGIRGDNVGGDIAIDDVSFTGCTLTALCPDDAFTCGGLECIHKDEQCDFISQCSDGEDEAYCGMLDLAVAPIKQRPLFLSRIFLVLF